MHFQTNKQIHKKIQLYQFVHKAQFLIILSLLFVYLFLHFHVPVKLKLNETKTHVNT